MVNTLTRTHVHRALRAHLVHATDPYRRRYCPDCGQDRWIPDGDEICPSCAAWWALQGERAEAEAG